MTESAKDASSVIKPPEVADGPRNFFCKGIQCRIQYCTYGMDMKIVVVGVGFS